MRLINILPSLLPLPKTVYIAVSGGVDSMVALHFLARNPKRNICILHFNHETDYGNKAKEFVDTFCKTNHITVYYGCLSEFIRYIDEPESFSKEEVWRIARYAFFNSIREKYGDYPIITAHHLDDVLEWYLLSTFHGKSKLIPYYNAKYNIIRPFLLTKKSCIYTYAEYNSVSFLTDPSNLDSSFDRNNLRNNIIPTVKEIHPGIYKMLSKKLLKAGECNYE